MAELLCLETIPDPQTRDSEHLAHSCRSPSNGKRIGGQRGVCEHAWYLDALSDDSLLHCKLVDSDIPMDTSIPYKTQTFFCCKGFSCADPEDFAFQNPIVGRAKKQASCVSGPDGMWRGFEPRRLQKKALSFPVLYY
jgi:hypothetical protein